MLIYSASGDFMKILKFEEKLIEFANMKSDEKFTESGLAFFSNGARVGNWFYVNKNRIFELNNEISKHILKEYEEFVIKREKEIKRKMELTKQKIERFERNCNLFYNIKDDGKYREDSGIKLIGDQLAYDWFNAYLNRIMGSTLEICKLIIRDYRKYIINEKKAKLIDERKKLHEFFCERNYEKFEINSNIKFKDGTLMYKWFLNNKDKIINSNELICIEIHSQYENYLSYLGLKDEFYKHTNLEKYDEDSNIRFRSGALMNDFFV